MQEDQNQQSPAQGPEIDPLKLNRLLQQIRDNQNLTMGIVGGLLGAIIGAVGWGLLTWLTHYQIGFAAIGVGFLAGFGVRYLGKGIDVAFSIVGALTALIGVFLGDIFWACIEISRGEGVPLSDVISALNPELIGSIFRETFSPIQLLFYGFAVWAGFKYAKRTLTPQEQQSLLR